MTASRTNSASTERRALLAALLFAAAGGVGACLPGPAGATRPALELFYVVLVVNTYFSVRCFAAWVSPRDRLQRGADVLLVGLYLSLSANFGDPRRFLLAATALFALSLFKHAALLERSGGRAPLPLKLQVNAVGALACVLALAGVLFGHAGPACWALAVLNAAANVYLLAVRPMYTPARLHIFGA